MNQAGNKLRNLRGQVINRKFFDTLPAALLTRQPKELLGTAYNDMEWINTEVI